MSEINHIEGLINAASLHQVADAAWIDLDKNVKGPDLCGFGPFRPISEGTKSGHRNKLASVERNLAYE